MQFLNTERKKQMAKKINVQSQDDFESELKSEVPVFDGTAVTILRQGEYAFKIVKITVDSKTLELGELEVIGEAGSKYEAVEKFKIAVIQNKII